MAFLQMAARNALANYLFLFLLILNAPSVFSQECTSALGMANGRIKDDQITTSGYMLKAEGYQARLRQNIRPWGAWCVYNKNGKSYEPSYDQYIQIDLLKVTKITKVATQGRQYAGGREFVRDYKIKFSVDGVTWIFYKDTKGNEKIFSANRDVTTVVQHILNPYIKARYIRLYPGYHGGKTECMRLELYGCIFNEAILSYTAPKGETTPNNKNNYTDRNYDGNKGLLTDGVYGLVNAKEENGKGWLGWSQMSAHEFIDLVFEFTGLRIFEDVVLAVSFDSVLKHGQFSKAQIFFAPTREELAKSGNFLENCQKHDMKKRRYIDNITIPLCENTGRFVKIRLYFGAKWLLLTEVLFNSVAATAMNSKLKVCSQDGCSTIIPTKFIQSTQIGTSILCKNCNTLTTVSTIVEAQHSKSNNLQMTVIIVCVILLVTIVLLVLIFLLYRRRALCFGKLKQRKKMEKNIHVELKQTENAAEPLYDKIMDNMGNPLYTCTPGDNDDTQPMLSPSRTKFDAQTELHSSEVYSDPDSLNIKGTLVTQDDYADPVDCLKPNETLGNPIYEGIYSEPLYGIAGTILVGPQAETIKRGYTMEKFPRDRLSFKEKIGDGQFGEVYIALADISGWSAPFGEEYAGKTKITVAVKTLKCDVEKDAKTDFFKEVRVMSRLQHENVVRLLAVCRDDPICMIVEYMENGDLNQFLKCHVLEDENDVMIYANTKQPISYEELMYIASQVASGMKYFAAMNFVHRDLAARNCLVGENLTVKLADFGMSRLLYSKHYYRVQGRVMLPIRWMAPESIFQGRFTTQTDVWSFGITLWEIFTLAQQFPYPNLSDEQVIANAKSAFTQGDIGVEYNEKPDVCTQDMFDMMRSCWTSNPTQRPSFDTLHEFIMTKVGSTNSAIV